jgi:hypothetical protein
VANDFFTVMVWAGGELVRYHVLFIIKLTTREVPMAGLVATITTVVQSCIMT